MCTGNKLRRASDQVLIKRNQERAELIQLRKGFAQVTKEKEAAEAESKRYADRCMRLTKNADISNLWMMFNAGVSLVLTGLVVYVL